MRIVIADDAMIVRAGLIRLLSQLGHQIVAETGTAIGLPELVAKYAPDLLIVDIRMPPHHGNDGLVAATQVRTTHPDSAILVLSEYVVPSYLTWLLQQTPDRVGYLLKDRLLTAGMLQDALTRLAAGQTVVDPDLVEQLLQSERGRSATGQLSPREREVLALMAQGLSDRGIAAVLFVSLNTVSTHIRHIFAKLAIAEGAADNRRVLAVLRWLEDAQPRPSSPPK